jgi:gamma-butyrobetaine dioxygenase
VGTAMWARAAGGDLELETPGATGGELVAFYAGCRRWAGLLARPERALTTRLRPGDCLIFDNARIRHGRTAFTSAGERHLQGCHADLDALASSLAMLERQEVAV